MKPLSADHVALTVTMSRATREKIRRAQELLGHTVAPEAIADVLDRALDQLIVALEKRKHGLHRKPRGVRAKVSHRVRHISADVRAALTTLGYNRGLVSIGLSAAATSPAETSAEARVKVALTALTSGLARKETPSGCQPVSK